jgi:hypothetical protein
MGAFDFLNQAMFYLAVLTFWSWKTSRLLNVRLPRGKSKPGWQGLAAAMEPL